MQLADYQGGKAYNVHMYITPIGPNANARLTLGRKEIEALASRPLGSVSQPP